MAYLKEILVVVLALGSLLGTILALFVAMRTQESETNYARSTSGTRVRKKSNQTNATSRHHTERNRHNEENYESGEHVCSDSESESDMYTAIETFQSSDEGDEDNALEDLMSDTETDTVPMRLLHKIDKYFDGSDRSLDVTLSELQDCLKTYPNNCEVLWRLAKICHYYGTFNPQEEEVWVLKGCDYAQQALECNGKSPEAHKWYGILQGSKALFSSYKEKVECASLFKKHIEEALKLKSTDASLYYLMAQFNFKIASLSWFERTMAEKFFGSMPTGTVESALDLCKQAEEISDKPLKQNKLLLAKCLIQKGDISRALDWLEEAAFVECITPEDSSAHKEVMELQVKWRR